MFATVFLGVLNPTTGLLVYINGGHEPLFIVSQTGKVQTLTPTGPAVGIMPCIEFKAQEVQLELGDILVGYTDGVTEAHAPSGELFTRKRLLSLLQEPAPSASAILERVKADLFAHIGDTKPSDDITMIALRRIPIAEG
jgi:sigma-B regulation protein RsbU (phosphoserine phosphatase)